MRVKCAESQRSDPMFRVPEGAVTISTHDVRERPAEVVESAIVEGQDVLIFSGECYVLALVPIARYQELLLLEERVRNLAGIAPVRYEAQAPAA